MSVSVEGCHCVQESVCSGMTDECQLTLQTGVTQSYQIYHLRYLLRVFCHY